MGSRWLARTSAAGQAAQAHGVASILSVLLASACGDSGGELGSTVDSHSTAPGTSTAINSSTTDEPNPSTVEMSTTDSSGAEGTHDDTGTSEQCPPRDPDVYASTTFQLGAWPPAEVRDGTSYWSIDTSCVFDHVARATTPAYFFYCQDPLGDQREVVMFLDLGPPSAALFSRGEALHLSLSQSTPSTISFAALRDLVGDLRILSYSGQDGSLSGFVDASAPFVFDVSRAGCGVVPDSCADRRRAVLRITNPDIRFSVIDGNHGGFTFAERSYRLWADSVEQYFDPMDCDTMVGRYARFVLVEEKRR